MRTSVLLDVDVDGHPSVYQLYTPQDKDPNLHLWTRRCELFVSKTNAWSYLSSLGIHVVSIVQHELFPELTVIMDDRGYTWYLCAAPVR